MRQAAWARSPWRRSTLAVMADYNLFYYPWITQHVDAFEIRQAINTFASAVEALVGKTIEVRQPVDVPAQIARVCERDGTIGLMNPLGFLLAKRRMPQVEAINVALRPEIIVAKDGTYKLGKLVPRYRLSSTPMIGLRSSRRRRARHGSSSSVALPARASRSARRSRRRTSWCRLG